MVRVVLLLFLAGTASAATLERQLDELHERAESAGRSRDWEAVERFRIERGRILAQADGKSPWVVGRRAIEAVDGDGVKPGLVDRLAYKDAAGKLLEAWKPFATEREGAVYGDIAVRLFKVGQQALAVHRDALTPGSPAKVVSVEILREAIEAAATRDPCQLEARAIRLFMRPPDRNETFLRLEVRPELRAINAGLLDLSWSGSGVVLPHHAPVEFMKAALTHRLVMEERYADFLATESADKDGNRRAGLVLEGIDARSAPFRLMDGRFLLMEVPDESGRPTAAFVYLDQKGEWDKRYLRLLYRTPTPEELKAPEAAFFADFFATLRPTTTWSLGPHEFGLYDLPVGSVEPLMRRDVRKISVRKVSGLSKGKFSRTSNELDFLVDQLEREPFPSHPQVLSRMQEFVAARDRTNHALVDLMGLRPGEHSTSLNPLIVMSSDDRQRPTLAFRRTGESGRPFLTLNDAGGSVMEFREDTKEFVVRFPGIDGHVPLSVDAIPDALVLSTAAGRLLESVLVDCGYTEEQAIAEIRKAFKDSQYVPQKFEDLVKAKQRSRQPAGRPGAARGGAGAGNAGQIAMEILREKGWSLPLMPGEDLQRTYRTYGFRYLSDGRGTIMTNPGLSRPLAADPGPPAPTGRRLDFRRKDGRKAIDESQIYTGADYEKLRQNMAAEFLPAVVALHPCLPSLEWPEYGLSKDGRGVASARIPDGFFRGWAGSESVSEKELSSAVKPAADVEMNRMNRLFSAYARTMLAARSDVTASEQVLAVQLKTARGLAKSGDFHRAIVLYDELVKMSSSKGHDESKLFQFDLFDRVPTPADLERFSSGLQSILEGQKRLLLLQAEQAAVLRAAGLPDSASFLFRRLIDQFSRYVLPAIELSEEYARSYAFSPGRDLERTRKGVIDYLEVITKASDGLRREGEFREAAARDGLEAWARKKVELRTSAPQALYAGEFLVNPVQACPATYDPDRGFRRDVDSLFADDLPEKLAAWAKLPVREAARDPKAGESLFLLGWFWLERKNSDFAWTAFIEAAKAFDPERGRDDLQSLVGRRNGMMMLVAAAGVVEAPPGVSLTKTDFVDGLRGQAILWERTWTAKRHDGAHAASQREIIEDLLGVARVGISLVEDVESKRYYFPDYTFRHGPLPDVLAADATRMKLFDTVPRDADDVPIEPPAAGKDRDPKEKKPQAEKPDEGKKEPENPPRELTFEQFMGRLYTFPAAIDPDILELSPADSAAR